MTDYSTHIEINIGKLLEWLMSRHHCPTNWSTKLEPIRKKISLAIQDMPENKLVKELLDGNYLHYFHCVEIVNILKETEASSKNIFGFYSSQRMKDWNEIVKLYQSEGVYLGEGAYLLNRYVNYELPALKKQLEKCAKTREELVKKKKEYESCSQEQQTKFRHVCESYSIQGESVHQEVVALAADLPTWLNELGKIVCKLSESIVLYEEFVHFVTKTVEFQACSALKKFFAHGNVTAYEWLHGVAPDKVESPHISNPTETTDSGTNIAWDDVGSDGIVLDIPTEDIGAGNGDTIDFEIEVESSAVEETESWSSGNAGISRVARGEEALSVLENATCRNQVLTDVHEVAAFLFRMLEERRSSGDGTASSGEAQQNTFALLQHDMWANAPNKLRDLSVQELKEMYALTQTIIQELTKPNNVRLFLIRSSPHYVETMVEEISSPLKEAKRFQRMAALAMKRAEETEEEEQQIRSSLALLRKNYTQLRDKMAEEISTFYNKRPIQFTGEGHFL